MVGLGHRGSIDNINARLIGLEEFDMNLESLLHDCHFVYRADTIIEIRTNTSTKDLSKSRGGGDIGVSSTGTFTCLLSCSILLILRT